MFDCFCRPVLFLAVLFAANAGALAAAEDEKTTENLGTLVESAKSQFRPVTAEDVAKAKGKLDSAVAELGRMLNASPRNGPGWKNYLHWEALQAQLGAGAKPDFSVLRDVYQRLTRDQPGLELPKYSRVAEALRGYVFLAAAAASPNQQEYFEQQLDALAKNVKQPDQQTSSELWQIGQVAGWLASTNRTPALVQSIRKSYAQPNGWVEISPELVGAGFRDNVDRVETVRDVILGTDVEGTGHTIGTISTNLVPDSKRATVELFLSGRTHTKTVGYNGPVAIHSRGVTKIAARKWLFFDHNGVRTSPATSDAITNTHVTGIDGGRLVTRIAWKKVGQQQGEANRVAAEHARAKIRARVDQEANVQVRRANQNYQDKFRLPLVRRGKFPELLDIRTNPDRLTVTTLQSSDFQLGAPTEPPASGGSYDLTARVHESLLNNLAEALLAGETLQSEQVRAEIVKQRGSLPEELKEGEDEEPWSITFPPQRPIVVEFADQGFKISVHGQRYTSGDRKFDAMNISAAYKIELTDTGARYVRQGEIRILPPGFVQGKDRLSIAQQSLVTILQKKFARMFREEIVSEGLELPGNWKRAGKLKPVEMKSEQGWLVAGWMLPTAVKAKEKTAAATGPERQRD